MNKNQIRKIGFLLFLAAVFLLPGSRADEGLTDAQLKATFQKWSADSIQRVPKNANPWHKNLVKELTARVSDKLYAMCVKSTGVDRSDCWQLMIRYANRMIDQPIRYGYVFFVQKYDFLLEDKDRTWLLDMYGTAPGEKGEWPYKWVRHVGLAGELDREKLPLVMSTFMMLDGIRHRAFGPEAHLKLNVAEPEFISKSNTFLTDFLEGNGSLLIGEFLQGLGMKKRAAAGAHVFFQNCLRCHGPYGDGKGPQEFSNGKPLPRNFARAEFKFKSTPIGSLPLDEDLIRTVTLGISKTPMPIFDETLTREQIEDAVQYVKTYSPRFVSEKPTPRTDVFPPPDEVLAPIEEEDKLNDEILKGKALYAKMGCWECHGSLGRGDGPSAGNLEDRSLLFLAPPNDVSDGIRFKSGFRVRDLFRTIALGIEGSGMPEYTTEALVAPLVQSDLTQVKNDSFPKFTDEEVEKIVALFSKPDKDKTREAHVRRRALALFMAHLNQSLSKNLRQWRGVLVVKIVESATVPDRETGEKIAIESESIGQILRVERVEDGTDAGKVFLLVRFFVKEKPVVIGFSEIPPSAPVQYMGQVPVKDLGLLKPTEES